jgi:tyrosyl-tRNA synthetase
MSGGLDALKERGFIQQCTDIEALERGLNSKQVTLYCGFDPTGPSLHAGHLIPLFAMSHLHQAGHRAIALVGGGTARIGDPSGKTEMRKMQSVETIQANALRIRDQIDRFLDFDGRNALLVDNADWLGNLNYIEFLRDIGRHFSVNRMLSFETYKMRLETGLSFIEFNYQLLQSYDYLILNQRQGCELQIGGDDQWGDIVAGVDLVRRVEGNDVFGLTFPLVTRADGKKMGKTEKGALYLDPAMTSPYDFYQYWRNVPDADVEKFLLLYTFLPVEEIREIGKREGKELNEGKTRLAFELTRIVHGDEEAAKARRAADAVFGGAGDTAALPSMELPRAELEAGINVVDLFARTSLCNTKSEARRLVQQGGAIVNEKKVADIDGTVDTSWLADGELLLRAGKKRYFRVVVTA